MASSSSSSSEASSSAPSASRLTSDVWGHISKADGKPKAKCSICGKLIAYRGGTTNLRNHLLYKHPLIYSPKNKINKTVGKRQSSLDDVAKPRVCSEAKAKEITSRILNMIFTDLRPVRMVECDGFKALMRFQEPGYTVPCRKHFTKLLRQKHLDCTEKLVEQLRNEADSLALTTDIWTSRAIEAYVTVTAHYFDPSWTMKSYVLETSAFPERHTGIEISGKLKDISDRFGITSKVSVVVHDNAANMVCSLSILEAELAWQSLSCTAHTLQLCLKPGYDIPVISRLLAAARKVVGHFNHSVVATEALKKKQGQMASDGDTKFKKVIRDCPTRWNSSLFMLQRLLKLRWPITAVLSDKTVTKRSDQYLDLKTDQWNIASDLVKVLEPFDVATTFLSYEENPSLSCVLPVLHGLIESLNRSADELPSVCQFKKLVLDEIKLRWSFGSFSSDNILVLGAMVDPRFKQLKFLDNEEEVKEAVKEEIIRRMERVIQKNCDESVVESNGSEGSASKRRKITALDYLLGPEDISSTLSPSQELDAYLAESPAPRAVSPHYWWESNHARFPVLSAVAKSILNIPATSTPSERVFSNAGNTVTQQRSSLKSSNVNALIFLNKNHDLF